MQWILPGWEEDVEIKIESRGSRNAQMTLTNRRETICFLPICNSSYMSLHLVCRRAIELTTVSTMLNPK
jgi:hypothetical protein